MNKSRSANLLIGIGFLWLLLAAALLLFHFTDKPTVEIVWETATEQGTVGFNVYRSEKAGTGYTLINADQFINSAGGPVSGAQYTLVDRDVIAGRTYYYILEEVEADGSTNRYDTDIVQFTVPNSSWWAIGLAVCSALFGLVMVAFGLKEKVKQ
jgi:hypothetical protein